MLLTPVSVKSSANTPAVLAVSSPSDAKQPTAGTEGLNGFVMDSPKKGQSIENEGTLAVVYGTADIANISGDSSGSMATDDLDIADELSAISITEEDHRQFLEELESL